MKNIFSLIAAASVLLAGLVSCNIEASRSFSGDLTIEVTGLPEEVKALSMWGSPNEFAIANIQENADLYIADVVGGTATFKLGTYVYSNILQCQFVPMTSREMAMSDATWWQTAFSGSSNYADYKNNFVYDFIPDGAAHDPMTLTLDVTAVYGDVSDVFNTRFHTKNYQTALTPSW